MVFTIWVTEACNMKCKYCYEGIEKRHNNMAEETGVAAAHWIVQELSRRHESHALIRFHGGEPLLNFSTIREVISVLKSYQSMDFDFELTTNAYALSDEQIQYISSNFDQISVSVDGTEAVHNKNRVTINGDATFQCVMRNALKIKKLFPQLAVRATITPATASCFYDSVLELLNYQFEEIICALDAFDQNWSAESLQILLDQSSKVKQYIAGKGSIRTKVYYPLDISLKKRSCSGGTDGFNIDINGKLYPCIYTVGNDRFVCGDIYTGIENSKIQELIAIYNTPIEACSGCSFYDCCESVRCKFVNLSITGNMFTPVPLLCAVCNIAAENCS